jgi:hypothetical protein
MPDHEDPVREHGVGSFTGDSEEKLKRYILRDMYKCPVSR